MANIMRSLIVAACFLAIPFLTSAQTDKSSWINLSALQPGQKIQVVQMSSQKITGTFSSVTDAAITLRDKSSEQTIQRQDVRIVRLMKNKHRLRNALIGAGVGAGVGAGIGAASYHQKCGQSTGGIGAICGQPFFSKGVNTAFGAAVGFVAGVAVGALWPTSEIIYHAAAPGS